MKVDKKIVAGGLVVLGILLWRRNKSKGVYTPVLDRKS